MHGPPQVGVVRGQLGDRLPGDVEAVHPEADRLPLQGPGRVLVRRLGGCVVDLGGEEEPLGAVADPGHADRRVDGGADDPGVAAGRLGGGRPGGAGLGRGDAVGVAPPGSRGEVHDPAGLGDAAGRAVLGQGVPGVEGEVLAVRGLAARLGVLLMQGQPGHPHRSARRLLPADRGPVQRHSVRVGAQLYEQVEGRLPGGQPVPQVAAEEGRVLVGRHGLRIAVRAARGDQLVLDVPLVPEAVRKHAPVRGRQRALLGLGHVLDDRPGDRMAVQVGLGGVVDHPGAGEFAHVAGGVDEEHVVVLEQEVLGVRGAVVRQELHAGHPEELDPDAEGGAQVGPGGHGVAGEPHPGGQPALGARGLQEADAQLLGQVGVDGEDAPGGAVGLEEDGPQRGFLPLRDPPALHQVHEHGAQCAGGVVGAVGQGFDGSGHGGGPSGRGLSATVRCGSRGPPARRAQGSEGRLPPCGRPRLPPRGADELGRRWSTGKKEGSGPVPGRL